MKRRPRLVYSTDPRARTESADGPAAPTPLAPSAHDLRVGRERSGRRGKTVTVVRTLQRTREQAAELLGQLKRRCGTGGTLRAVEGGFALEIQGDQVERALEGLAEAGYPAKRSGG